MLDSDKFKSKQEEKKDNCERQTVQGTDDVIRLRQSGFVQLPPSSIYCTNILRSLSSLVGQFRAQVRHEIE